MVVEFNYDPKRKEVRIVTDYFSNIKEAFSVKNPGAWFVQGRRFIPSRIYAITNAGYCGVGLVPEIINWLKKQTIPFDIRFNDEMIKVFDQTKISSFSDKRDRLHCDKFELRDYQEKACTNALSRGFGVIELATAGGKTFIMANIVYTALKSLSPFEKVLIVVPDIGLVSQSYDDFISYNFPEQLVGKWTGSIELDLTKRVIIANSGILQSKLSDLKWFKEVGLLIVDECHKLRRGNKINKILDKIPTLRRIGLTGTLPEEVIDCWNISNYIGPVIFKMTTTDLRNAAGGEYIAHAQLLGIHIEYNYKPDYSSVGAMARYRFELDFIHKNAYRTKVIKSIVSKLNNNCLILVDYIEHGMQMYDSLRNIEGKSVYFIQGDVDIEDRKVVQDLMEKQNNIVCIAISKIFSVGISIKNIHYIMFAAGGKAKIKTLQSIGRGLRVHKSKDVLTIIDLIDGLVYGDKHFDKRKQFYENENIPITERTVYETN